MAKQINAIVCADKAEFDAMNKRIWDYLVKRDGAKGIQWADTKIKSLTDNYVCPVEEARMLDALTGAEKARIEKVPIKTAAIQLEE